MNERPLKRSIVVVCSLFIALLCLVLSVLTYTSFTRALYHAYENRMDDILNYVENHIDMDNLSDCIDSGVESDKYKALVSFMDGIMEDFDIHFLYIIRPISSDAPTQVMNIISADTAYGREHDPDGLELNTMIVDAYEPKDLQLYIDAMQKDGISYFKNFSDWGYDYTALKALINSKGERFAVLCVDIEVSEMRNHIKTYTAASISLVIVLGIVFITLFLAWMTRNITEPITRLEKSVVSFASKSHAQKNPDLLNYDDPKIHTHNEVESLSNAVAQMSEDMRIYVKSIIDAEGKVESMKSKVNQMDMLAYQDALTHVKNKAWYDKTRLRVDNDIAKGTARFGILMADLNDLKKINDTYGHEHGNDYIAGSCHEICILYDHSPVFRIGGDEFVVLLEKRDYDNRDELLTRLRAKFEQTSNDSSKEPWERYSAAIGMAIYDSSQDTSMDDVFKRADKLMYQDKIDSKKARE